MNVVDSNGNVISVTPGGGLSSSANKIRVDTGKLKSTKANLESLLKSMETALENISEDVAAMNAMWVGDAHTAFVSQVEADLETMRSACDTARGIVNYEENAIKEYNACEKNVADLVKSLKV